MQLLSSKSLNLILNAVKHHGEFNNRRDVGSYGRETNPDWEDQKGFLGGEPCVQRLRYVQKLCMEWGDGERWDRDVHWSLSCCVKRYSLYPGNQGVPPKTYVAEILVQICISRTFC